MFLLVDRYERSSDVEEEEEEKDAQSQATHLFCPEVPDLELALPLFFWRSLSLSLSHVKLSLSTIFCSSIIFHKTLSVQDRQWVNSWKRRKMKFARDLLFISMPG